jgi:nitroreductase
MQLGHKGLHRIPDIRELALKFSTSWSIVVHPGRQSSRAVLEGDEIDAVMSRAMESATQRLHRVTSYAAGGDWEAPPDDPLAVLGFEPTDIETHPWFFKRYDSSLPRLELPRDLPATSTSAVEVLAGAEVPPGTLDLWQLGRLLYLSAGIVRTTEHVWGTFSFRAAGSAGGRFPIELYVAVPEGTGLPAGVHWYQPEEHSLLTIGPPPRGGTATIVSTGVPWRTGWRYRERGYRHVYWDSGTMLSQLLAAADSAGIGAMLYTRFPDGKVTELVGADGTHEWPVAVVALGGLPALEPGGEATGGEVDHGPREFPLASAAQRGGDADALGEPWPRGSRVELPLYESGPVERVVLRRSSQRRMDRTRGLTHEAATTMLAAAMRGIDVPHFVVVHDVEAIEPGVYRWPDLAGPVQRGDLRDELGRIALGQGLAHDAAFVAIGAAPVATLDDHDYREAQLAAGIVEGRLHLAAYALGAAASGMTFLDSEIPALLGEPLDALLFTCVGVPSYRSRPGGPPGHPVRVSQIVPLFRD